MIPEISMYSTAATHVALQIVWGFFQQSVKLPSASNNGFRLPIENNTYLVKLANLTYLPWIEYTLLNPVPRQVKPYS